MEAKELIRGLLTVDPANRLTAAQALDAPFFLHGRRDEADAAKAKPRFHARRRFRVPLLPLIPSTTALKGRQAAIMQVRVLIRLLRVAQVPELVPVASILLQPYGHRKLRRSIDGIAFRFPIPIPPSLTRLLLHKGDWAAGSTGTGSRRTGSSTGTPSLATPPRRTR